MQIGDRRIGPGFPTFVVAEMSGNHGHSLDTALAIVRAAKDSGADAIKLQTYTPDTLTIDCDREPFHIHGTSWDGRTLHQLYAEAYTPWDWHPMLQRAAHAIGLGFFSTPFDDSAVQFLETLHVPAYKIASFELVDLALLRTVARTGKPIILSTGMATAEEIHEALSTIVSAGGKDVALLKCTSAYPAQVSDMNLLTIPDMVREFGVPIGLSDHTLGNVAAITAVALGACIVEKHFTLSRDMPGPDTAFSLEPAEFRQMVDAVREAEQARGVPRYGIAPAEASSVVFRRSLFAVADIRAGDELDSTNVRCIRPGVGLHPRHLDEVLGSRAAVDIRRGTPLQWDLIRRADRGDD